MLRSGLLIICLLFVTPIVAGAHPHVFIDNYLKFEFDTKGLAGIQVTWIFDEMYSSCLLMDYDNGDGILSPVEIREIKAEAFDNLKHYGYFMRVRIDGAPFEVKFVKDFNITTRGGNLLYHFTVPCHVSAAATPKKLSISVVDETSYSAIMTGRSAISLEAAQPYTVHLACEPAPLSMSMLEPEAVGSVNIQFSQP